MSSEEAEARVLGTITPSRRAFLKKLILGSAFVAPAIASFSMSGAIVERAEAKVPNQSQFAYPGLPGQPNCILQTVAYIEHPLGQAVSYTGFIDNLRYILGLQNLDLAHGVWAIAEQWCRYGGLVT